MSEEGAQASQDAQLESIRIGGASGADFEAWERFYSESLHGDQIQPLGEADFEGQMTRRWIDDCLITETRTSPHAARFHKSSSVQDYVVLWGAYPAGGERAVLTDGSRVESKGVLSILDSGTLRMYEQYMPRHGHCLFVPKDALIGHGVRVDRMGLPRNFDHSATARLMLVMIESLLRPAVVPLPEAIAVRDALLGLFQGLRPEEAAVGSPVVNEAMRVRLEEWVARRLLNGDVSPDAAAKAHGISVRSLHRIFSGSGRTFSGFVRTLRLERARHDLVTTPLTIQTIASRWGYSDVSHFSREFRKAYGVTASDFRASTGTDDASRALEERGIGSD